MATQVLILAAGRGSRLGPKTQDIPKPLLQIGPRTLVEHQLEMFANAGLGPVGMVVGYQADEIRATVGIRAEYLENPRWATSNSMVSFSMARDWAHGDLLILNCDVLPHPKILDRLLSAGVDCFAYDSSSGNGREHMKVQLQNGCLVAMGKELVPEDTHGENVGILYFGAETVRLLFDAADRWIATEGIDAWLGAAVQRLAQRVPIRGVDIAPLPWVEIDFAFDLDRARKEVWPAIRGGTRRVRRRTLVTAVAGLVVAAMLQTGFYASSHPLQGSSEWETLSFDASTPVEILSSSGKRQAWWVLEAGRLLEIDVVGPDAIRLESRLILSRRDAQERPYILGVSIDSEPTQWLTATALPSRAARWGQTIISKRTRSAITIPPGAHRIRLELHGITGDRCLIRLLQSETDSDVET